MAKRFTDNDIWKKQRWFKKLTPNDKLVFFYIKDQCTHWGMWKIDCIDLMEDTGIENFDLNEFVDCVNTDYDKITGKKVKKKRIIILPDNILWLTGFMQFQWENKAGRLSINVPAVKTGLSTIISLGLLEITLKEGFITLIDGYEEIDKIKDFLGMGSEPIGSSRVAVYNNLNNKTNGKKNSSSSFAAQAADIVFARIADTKSKVNGNGNHDSLCENSQ